MNIPDEPYVIVMLIRFMRYRDVVNFVNFHMTDFGDDHVSTDGCDLSVNHISELEYDNIIDALDENGLSYTLVNCVWKEVDGSVRMVK